MDTGQSPITIEHFRQHVLEDVADLISALGILDPLIYDDLGKLPRATQQAGRFLRKLLARNVVLILARLHERSNHGRAGPTASIDSLLDHSNGLLAEGSATQFKESRGALIADLESKGIRYSDLYEFRTTEMAHSIHRTRPLSASELPYYPISEFAHDTYELVLKIENELVVAGLRPFVDLPGLFHVWKDRGQVFWEHLIKCDPC